MKLINLIAIAFGAMLVTGAVGSPTEPCTANDKLIDIIKDQQGKLSQLLVDSKREADAAKKKYEEKLAELEKMPCKPMRP